MEEFFLVFCFIGESLFIFLFGVSLIMRAEVISYVYCNAKPFGDVRGSTQESEPSSYYTPKIYVLHI